MKSLPVLVPAYISGVATGICAVLCYLGWYVPMVFSGIATIALLYAAHQRVRLVGIDAVIEHQNARIGRLLEEQKALMSQVTHWTPADTNELDG